MRPRAMSPAYSVWMRWSHCHGWTGTSSLSGSPRQSASSTASQYTGTGRRASGA